MSMMRTFTTRRKQPELDGHLSLQLGRAASQRGGRPVTRTQISGPVALVSTTNMLSYNAPDIVSGKIEQHSSSSSEESDGSGNSVHSHDTDPTDISSADASPISAEPEPNHLSQYFKPTETVQRSPVLTASPSLPKRAPSHSKRAHEALSRKRSVQRALSPAKGRGVSRTRASVDMFAAEAALVDTPRENPFGQELAQLDAVVEEYAATRAEDAEASYLRSKGLGCFAASEYLNEIDSLVHILLDDKSPTVPDFSGWF